MGNRTDSTSTCQQWRPSSEVSFSNAGNNNFTSIGKVQYSNQPLLYTDSSKILITADTSDDGVQLFRTDATTASTLRVKRINPDNDAFYFFNAQ